MRILASTFEQEQVKTAHAELIDFNQKPSLMSNGFVDQSI